LLIVLLIAFAVPIFLSRIKHLSIPIAVGEIVAGMIVGRSGFSFVPPDDLLVGIFANFGIVFLMFLSGMEIDFNSLRSSAPTPGRSGRKVLWLALSHFALTLCLASVAAYFLVRFGLATNRWIMALILSTTSLGVVVPVLKETNLIGQRLGQCILVSAVLADFATMLLITLAVAIALAFAVWGVLRYTDLGRALRAAAQDGPVAAAFGVNEKALGLLLAGTCAALASIAGVCLALSFTLTPSQMYAWVGVVFAAVMLGGLGSARGPLVAGMLIGVSEAVTMAVTAPSWAPIVSFTLLIVILLFRPGKSA